ncbi:hypothetical protein BABINDRAFT_160988 [Babjeviella inositovora NRRL Y-12698]|uniref:RNB domain-containing protein n=1 Tax=Babjeviella inositovora NRRL Y-12698 TaxID=984486 RepID=A0A1E3QST6_9ASCO|nr:uncharacterized protein BABINDRAFT_160988 [Babjeviella inositovora NRRL Y-12698]ODQ80775.1 hypothetical protein BABINDRAFT_160988 [Babjeviella inositovora NRRL Y-12698]
MSANDAIRSTANDIRTTGLKPPRKLHIAHRRSPSELTNLMIEQFNLQKQLEYVQQQQQQIIQDQKMNPETIQQALAASNGPATPFAHQRGHSRTGSNVGSTSTPHRRGGSVNYGNLSHNPSPSTNPPGLTVPTGNQALGHIRRHSLGIHEAKKAAAYAQSQRVSPSRTASTSESTRASPPPAPPAFKFPPEPETESPKSFLFPQKPPGLEIPFPSAPPGLTPPNAMTPPSYGERRGHTHYRSNSRNFDPNTALNINSNWRSPLVSSTPQHQPSQPQHLDPFVPGHRNRSSMGGSMSSMQGVNPNQGAGPQRKSLFAPYLPQSSLPELVAEGRLVVGTLRVNKKNRSDAYVSTDGLLDADIFICGSKDRNRALEGDLVAVELLVVDEVWGSKKEKEEKKRRKDQLMMQNDDDKEDSKNDATGSDTFSVSDTASSTSTRPGVQRRGSLKQRPTQKKNDDVEVEGQSLLLVEEEEINDDYKPLYAGHVVAVVDRIPGQLFAGTLGLLRPSQAANNKDNQNLQNPPPRPKIVWFKPTDKKVPLIAIPTEQAPKDFVENHEAYLNKLFVASIKRWPITSLHPFGTLISQLGDIDASETDIESILRDNNFLCDEYPEDSLGAEKYNYVEDLPSIKDIDDSRKVFTSEYILSFTQANTISDHAIHVKRLSDSKIELGVHIADVTYYILQGSVLDKKARKRSSSVFLAQKTAHLLPDLVNKLASFIENEQNLAVSVVFEIDTNNFEVDGVWMGESVIVPKQKVCYDEVDSVLEASSAQILSSATSDYIKTLSLISREFRRQRLNNKTLNRTPNLALLNQLDDEKVRLDLNIFKDHASLSMMDEILYKVNAAVAQKVHAVLGESALLRRHPLPTLSKIESFAKRVEILGFNIDTSTSTSLQTSILKIEDPVKRKAVESFLFKAMSRGKYVIAGKTDSELYNHYYLNVPLYTHFTAPLRRYADLIVHRQLKAVLHQREYTDDIEALKMTAEYCNFKKDCAYSAQEQSVHLLLSQTINEMSESTGQLLCMGTVVQVYESAFDVFIPEFGIEKRVHGDQLPLVKAEFDKGKRVLELYWEKGVDSATYIPHDERQPLSYRNSIKNKFRTSSMKAASHQNKVLMENQDIVSDALVEKLAKLNFEAPRLAIPRVNSGFAGASQLTDSKSLPGSPAKMSPLAAAKEAEDIVVANSNTGSASSSTLELLNLGDGSLKAYLSHVKVRVESDTGYYIQEIKELEQVPVILRAEIGMALPCLTVRALNPYTNVK